MDPVGWLFGSREKATVRAVHPSDLDGVLESLGVRDRVENELAICEVCNRNITRENIGRICPKEEVVRFRCDKIRCVAVDDVDRVAPKRIRRLQSYSDDVKTEQFEESLEDPYEWDRKETAYQGHGGGATDGPSDRTER